MTGDKPTARRFGVPLGIRRWTLRARLGVILVSLAGVALLTANAVGLIMLRSYLTDKVDDQLVAMGRRYERLPTQFELPPPSGPQQVRPFGPDVVVYVYDVQGTLVHRQGPSTGRPPPALDGVPALPGRARNKPFTVPGTDGGSAWRMLTVTREGGGAVVLGASLHEVDATADSLLAIDGAVTVAVLMLLGLATVWIVRLGLRPLTRMEAIAGEISAGDLSRRVDDTDPHTEPGRLGIALNTMLVRIEQEVAARTASEQRMRQFLADASHELRTPLTSIRGFAELYRRGGAPPGPLLDETMSRIESEAARMGVLVDDLLLLARLDLQRPLHRHRVDLLAIAADTIRDAHARAPGRPVRLAPVAESFEPVTVPGDEHRLRQVAANLVANALQHTPADTAITVRVGRLGPGPAANVAPDWPAGTDAALLEVADTGPGIAAEHAPRVFERLYRADGSRTRGHGVGAGLGLSIVAAIVHSHGGSVSLDTAIGHGAVFRILLPVLDGDDADDGDRIGQDVQTTTSAPR